MVESDEVTSSEEDSSDSHPLSPYRWLGIVDRLAGGDFTKYDDVYKKNYISSLNTLSYWKTKEEIQAKNERQRIKKSKRQRR